MLGVVLTNSVFKTIWSKAKFDRLSFILGLFFELVIFYLRPETLVWSAHSQLIRTSYINKGYRGEAFIRWLVWYRSKRDV